MGRPLVLSGGGPRMAPLLRHSVPTFERYAEAHGYDVLVATIDDAAALSDPAARRRARWRKLELLADALGSHPLVLWMDADAMFRRFDRDIADDLPPGCFQGLVMEILPTRCNPNTGVWLLRAGPTADAFLGDALRSPVTGHSWSDQATVCALLGWHLGDRHGHGARPSRPSPYLDQTAWLPEEWNPLGRAAREHGRVLHCAGMPFGERLAHMARLTAALNTGAARRARYGPHG